MDVGFRSRCCPCLWPRTNTCRRGGGIERRVTGEQSSSLPFHGQRSHGVVSLIARLYSSPGDARALLVEVGLPVERHPAWDGSHALDFWWRAWKTLSDGAVEGGLSALLSTALDAHPGSLDREPLRLALDEAQMRERAAAHLGLGTGGSTFSAAAEAIGRFGREHLLRRTGLLPNPVDVPRWLDWDALKKLRAGVSDQPDADARTDTLEIIDDLLRALDVTALLRPWLVGGSRLTSVSYDRALNWVLPDAPLGDLSHDLDYVTRLVLCSPGGPGEFGRSLVAFATLLRSEATLDVEDAEFVEWTIRYAGQPIAGDVHATLRTAHGDRRRKLVVSLHACLAGSWPDSVQAWVVGHGPTDDLSSPELFSCDPPSRAETERAVCDAVAWAMDLVGEDAIRQIDLALPSSLLVGWNPEEITDGQRLGIDYDVIVRWGDLLKAPPRRGLGDPLRIMRQRLERHAADEGGLRVHWLSYEDALDEDRMCQRLAADHMGAVYGLRFHPAGRHGVLEALLSFIPIVLWPGDESQRSWQTIEEELGRRWKTLPAGFANAYRGRWQVDSDAQVPPPPLSELRFVWNGPDWLDFCRRMRPPNASAKGRR